MGYEGVAFPESTRVLVTGGAGFIGSNLVEALLKKGVAVRVLDDLSTGFRENIEPFLSNERFEFIEGDVKDLSVCEKACKGIDFVMHEAAWGSVPRSIERPLFYCANNIQGTLNMFEGARRAGTVKTFVCASSSSVYGDDPNLPKREGREGKLLSPYAATKKALEDWGRQYALHYGLKTVMLRYFNVFGKRQTPNGAYAAVIPRFIKTLLSGERPTIHGDGLQSRDFTYIENVVEANLKACFAPDEASGEAFNIAFGESARLIDVYYAITKALGLEVEPRFDSPRAGDIRHSLADVEKARRLLGYAPDYSLERGLQEAIEWYRKALS